MPETDRTGAQGLEVAGKLGALARGIAQHGGGFLREQVQSAEHKVLRNLKDRLDDLDGPSRPALSAPTDARPSNGSGATAAPASQAESLQEQYEQLLNASMNQDQNSAQEAVYRQLIQELVPDEIRLLNAASEGLDLPVVHLEATSRLGSSTRVLSNISRVGNECGVMLNRWVPFYLDHLVGMGLLEWSAENRSALTKYEMIESDSDVRKAMDQISNEMKLRPKLIRCSVRISAMGRDFLVACGAIPG